MTEPRALLLDEPLAALDHPTKSAIVGDLRNWNQHHRIPILFVTHNGEEVFALGDEVIVLDAGRIVAQGRPHEVMRAPRLETVAHLSGFENIFDATVVALHEDRGTMTCRLGSGRVEKDAVELKLRWFAPKLARACAWAFAPAICCWQRKTARAECS